MKTTQILFPTYQIGPNSKVLQHTLGKVGGETGTLRITGEPCFIM